MKVMNGMKIMKIMKIMRIMKDCGVTVTRLDVSTFVVDLADLLLTYLKVSLVFLAEDLSPFLSIW